MWAHLVSHRVSWQLWGQKEENPGVCVCGDACSSARNVSRDAALPCAIKSPHCSGQMKAPETCLKCFNFFSSNWILQTKIFKIETQLGLYIWGESSGATTRCISEFRLIILYLGVSWTFWWNANTSTLFKWYSLKNLVINVFLETPFLAGSQTHYISG